jgi:conjugal transfer mating pair stabilization protein TraG
MESGISRLNTGINFQDRISASISNQADNSYNFAKGNQLSWAENTLSSIRQIEDVGTTLNNSINSGDSYSLSNSSGFQKSATDYASAVERFAHDTSMSKQDAGRYLAGAYVNASAHAEFNTDRQIIGKVVQVATGASAGGRITTGLKGEADRSWTTTDSENFQKAQDFIRQNNLNETLDKAIRGVQEERYQTDNRTGSHVNENIAASLDEAKQASINFTKNYQESLSYREAANYSKDNASMININANQDFIEYVATQPLGNSRNPMGMHQAEALLRSDNQLRNLYANDFIEQQTNKYYKDFKTNNHLSNSHVKQYDSLDSQYQKLSSQVDKNNVANKITITNDPRSMSLSNTFHDESLVSKVKHDVIKHNNSINETIDQHENKREDFKQMVANKIKSNKELERPVNKIVAIEE